MDHIIFITGNLLIDRLEILRYNRNVSADRYKFTDEEDFGGE